MAGMTTSHFSRQVKTEQLRISDYLRELRIGYLTPGEAPSRAALTTGERELCGQIVLCYEGYYSCSLRAASVEALDRLKQVLEGEVKKLSAQNDLENTDTRARLLWYLPQALAYKMDQALGILSTESLS